MTRSTHHEAAGAFEQALSALDHLPQQHDTNAQAIDLRLALRAALVPMGDYRRILAALHEAEALAEALDDPRRLARVSIFLSVDFCRRGLYDQAIVAARRALALATASGEEVALQALANHFLGRAYYDQGNYRQAIDCYQQIVASLDETRYRERFGDIFPPAVRERVELARCHAELGTFAEGEALGEEGLRIAEAVDHPASLMVAYWGIGLLALRQGDLSRALPLLARAMDLCQNLDLRALFPFMAAALGAAYTLGGHVTDAVPLLTRALEQTAALERVDNRALCLLPLGEAHMLAGRLEEAQILAERALAHARAHQERGHQAYALRLLGAIAARREPPQIEPAEASYRQALSLAEALGMRPLQAHCHHGLGTLHTTVGQREKARAALTMAIEMYRAMDMTFRLSQAETALAQVG